MNWKKELRKLEKAKKWDEAIALMQKIIQQNLDNVDAYIFMNYLLMNLLVEEDYDNSKEKTYETLLKWYFDESYAKFFDNAEYLYLMAKTAVMSEWLFGISVEDYNNMVAKAHYLDPTNFLYNEDYYWFLEDNDPHNPALLEYANALLTPDSCIERQLKNKGAIGDYLLEMKRNWAKHLLERLAEEKEKIKQDTNL